jgi:hypothetical protein
MRIFNLFKRKSKKVYLVMAMDNTYEPTKTFSGVIAAFESDKDARDYSKSYSQKTGDITYLCIVNLQ